jgi:hypothetical protein
LQTLLPRREEGFMRFFCHAELERNGREQFSSGFRALSRRNRSWKLLSSGQ